MVLFLGRRKKRKSSSSGSLRKFEKEEQRDVPCARACMCRPSTFQQQYLRQLEGCPSQQCLFSSGLTCQKKLRQIRMVAYWLCWCWWWWWCGGESLGLGVVRREGRRWCWRVVLGNCERNSTNCTLSICTSMTY